MPNLTKAQEKELEYILNFYLYEDGHDHSTVYIIFVERIKALFGFEAGNNN